MRNFFGLPIEKFHQPCAAWHHSGHYIYAAAAYGQVYAFHVASTKARPVAASGMLPLLSATCFAAGMGASAGCTCWLY